MLKKNLLGLPLLAVLPTLALMVMAGPAAAQSSPAKNELVVKILQLQRPAIEGLATMLANQPAQQMMQGANVALQSRIAPEKRQELAKEIEADLKKYANEVVPIARERAVKLAPGTIGALLEEKFSEDELRELIKIMESPVNKKFGQLNGELQKSLAEKLVADARPVIDPKVKALEATIAKRLGLEPMAASSAAASAAAKPAKPASK
jgi:uncharacterized protein